MTKFIKKAREVAGRAWKSVKRNGKKVVCAAGVAAATVATAPSALAQEADVDGIVTDAGALLTSIYPIVIGAVGFGIMVGLVKMVRRK